ncbi:MAG: PHP domain-containing protein [Oscillospiraceae bacterium]|nr:PHP domain-containing protein [Oscillospiraceae bacterium]
MDKFYDLHIHSCLSPCAEDDMTPGNICAMAALAGLEIAALTDHNSCGNVRPFIKRAEENGLIGVPGMELTTREEIHIVCLFPDCGAAERFSGYVSERLPDIPNRPDIFGRQLYIGNDDEPLREEPRLLLNAADIGVYEAAALIEGYGGIAYPAHIDRDAFSLLTVLGIWDDALGFSLTERTAEGLSLPYIISSDAHRLEAIPDPSRKLKISAPTAQAVIDALKSL